MRKKTIDYFSKVNLKQIVNLLFFSPLIFSLFIYIYKRGYEIRIALLLIYILFLYLVIRSLWLLATPKNDTLKYKEKAIKLQANDICPLCSLNRLSNNQLKIGYRKRYWEFEDRFTSFSYATSNAELFERINICTQCSEKYKSHSKSLLKLFFKNPSKILLKRKYGFKRGIVYSFELWNLTSNDI
jgi:hypothetical protein